MRLLHLVVVACVFATPGFADQIDLSSSKTNVSNWSVSEVYKGNVVTAPAVYLHKRVFGGVPGFKFPFSKKNGDANDGYWYADIGFTLPQGATKVKLVVTAVGVDDRCVVELNGKHVTDAGYDGPGDGFMTYKDGGANKPYTFVYGVGAQSVTVGGGFVDGVNDLRIIVNNTNNGIQGAPMPPGAGDHTSVGIKAYVTYDMN